MNYNLIVAMCKNRGIGKNNTIPWYCKNDLKLFSKLTKGSGNNAIIMGRKTWESLPKKPLVNRTNIVISRTQKKSITNNVIIMNNIDEAVTYCNEMDFDETWVIGGSSIYKGFLDKCIINNIYMSYIDKLYDCDVYFPELERNWKLIEEKHIEDDNLSFILKILSHDYMKSNICN